MAVAAARKGLQIPLGFRLGSDSCPFVLWPTDPLTGKTGATIVGTPTITLYASDGSTVKLAAANMALQADGSWAYWADLSSAATWPLGTGYQARFRYVATISGGSRNLEAPRQLFGIYPEPAQPIITDEDLLEEVASLNAFLGDNTDWSIHVQESWNHTLRRIGEKQDPGGSTKLDPYTLRSTDIAPLHKAAAMQRVFSLELRRESGDRWDMAAEGAAAEFTRALDALMETLLDRYSSGPTVAPVTPEHSRIRGRHKSYGFDATMTSTADRDTRVPAFTPDTEF